MYKSVTLIILLTTMFSCDYFYLKKDNRKPIARVNDAFLYEEELLTVTPKNIGEKDSILFVQSYINKWIDHQLLLSKAKINLEDKTEEFELLVKKYKEDLYINSYKQAVVKQYLDTTITQKDIDSFYKKNSKDYKLNEDLLQLKFLKIAVKHQNKKEIIKLFKSKEPEDIEKLSSEELSLKAMHLNDSIWVTYTDVLKQLSPFIAVNKKEILKNNQFIQKEDTLNVYLMAVKKVLLINQTAPKTYITPTIKQMILHQRKLLLLKKIEETIVDDAKNEKQFEIY